MMKLHRNAQKERESEWVKKAIAKQQTIPHTIFKCATFLIMRVPKYTRLKKKGCTNSFIYTNKRLQFCQSSTKDAGWDDSEFVVIQVPVKIKQTSEDQKKKSQSGFLAFFRKVR